MIAPNMDMLASLAALIGVNAPAPAGKGTNFAGLLASVTTNPEAQGALPLLEMSSELPIAPEQLVHNTPMTADADEPTNARTFALKIANSVITPERDKPIVEDGAVLKPAKSAPVSGAYPDIGGPAQPISDPVIIKGDAAVDAAVDVAELPTFRTEALPPVASLEPSLVIMDEGLRNLAAPGPAQHLAAGRSIENQAPLPSEVRIAIAAPTLLETLKSAPKSSTEKPELLIFANGDSRPASLMPTTEKIAVSLPERTPTFAPLIADAARDLVNLAQDKNVRFNIRPETLGPIAVTIERSEAGPTLRFGVETQAAVQAVRQAEPTMNDQRGQAPFVQVTVDLNAPDQRGRPARTPMIQKHPYDDAVHVIEQPATLSVAGRYA